MAITVGTEGPKLEKVRVEQSKSIVNLQAKFPFDADVAKLVLLDCYSKTLITALTANNDVTFDAVFTETTIT